MNVFLANFSNMGNFDALALGLFAIVGYGIALAIPIFLLVFAWRAVKALEASARAQHDAVVALRSIATSQIDKEKKP